MPRLLSSSPSPPFPLSIPSLLLAAISCCLLAVLLPLSSAQPYIPQYPLFTSCPPSAGAFTAWGDDNTTHLTNRVEQSSTSAATASYIYLTQFNQVAVTATIYQLSLGLLDNSQLATVAHVRLGLFVAGGATSGSTLTLLGQTEEIVLYPSSDQVLYANLQTPVTLPLGAYQLGMITDTVIYTGGTPAPTTTYYNAASFAYSSYGAYGFLTTNTISYSYPSRAMGAYGCSSGTSPYSDSANVVYTFCASVETVVPTPTGASYSSGTQTLFTTLNGYFAVSATPSGTNSYGSYYAIVASQAAYRQTGYAAYYYPSTLAGTSKNLSAGTGPLAVTDQLFYPNAVVPFSPAGMSFLASDGTQYIVRASSTSPGGLQIQVSTQGVLNSTYGGISASLSSAAGIFNLTASCGQGVAAAAYTADTLTCPTGSTQVTFGETERLDTLGTYYTEGSGYMYGNWIWFRQFTAYTPATVLYQLSLLTLANPSHVVRMRMGLFTTTQLSSASPNYTLVAQTAEVLLQNVGDTQVRANLLTPYTMVQGANYTIGYTADSWLYASYGYYLSMPYYFSLPYSAQTATSFPASVQTTYATTQTFPLGAYGCALQQTVVQLAFCAQLAYTTTSTVYTGVLQALSTIGNNAQGTYYTVISAQANSSVYTLATGVQTTYNMSLHSFNLFTNNLVYPGQVRLLDTYGLQFIVQTPLATATYAVQLNMVNDPTAGWRYSETQQLYSTTSQTTLVNVVSNFTLVPYTGGALPACPILVRPANQVTPASVARVTCPSITDSIQVTFGDASGLDYAAHAEGTSILPNVVYTNNFTAASTATVSQIAIGVLNNAAIGNIAVRLGLYDGTTGGLLGNTTIYLASVTDQVVIVNLPSGAVTLTAGRPYFIAVQANTTLDIATSAGAASPSMASAFGTGLSLPSTFVSSGLAVTPSVAAYGCVSTTHSFCAYFQYWTPGGSSVTTLYQGLLQATGSVGSNANGAYIPITAAAGHYTAYTRPATTPSPTSTSSLSTFAASSTSLLYTANAQSAIGGGVLDSTGLSLVVGGSRVATLSYSASGGGIVDSTGSMWGLGNAIVSGLNISVLNATSGIPNCALNGMPRTYVPQPATPSCPAGQSAVIYGDDVEADLGVSQEEYYYMPANSIYLRAVTSSLTSYTALSTLAFGLNQNSNAVTRFRFAVYDAGYNLLAYTPVVSLLNPADVYVVANLTTPLTIPPATTFYIGLWTESAAYAGYTAISAPAMSVAVPFNGNTPPTLFANNAGNSQRPVQAFACTVPAPVVTASSTAAPVVRSSSAAATSVLATSTQLTSAFVTSAMLSAATSTPAMCPCPAAVSSAAATSALATSAPATLPTFATSARATSALATSTPATSAPVTVTSAAATSPLTPATSTSTGAGASLTSPPSSSSGSSLSNGAIAGIVVGCVLGSNLLLLCCLWLCFASAVFGGKERGEKGAVHGRRGEELPEVSMTSNGTQRGGNVEMIGKAEDPSA